MLNSLDSGADPDGAFVITLFMLFMIFCILLLVCLSLFPLFVVLVVLRSYMAAMVAAYAVLGDGSFCCYVVLPWSRLVLVVFLVCWDCLLRVSSS